MASNTVTTAAAAVQAAAAAIQQAMRAEDLADGIPVHEQQTTRFTGSLRTAAGKLWYEFATPGGADESLWLTGDLDPENYLLEYRTTDQF